MSGFVERLQEVIGEQSAAAFALRCGLPATSIRSYLQGSEPGMERLIIIADTGGVSLEWLATGRGEKYSKNYNLGKYDDRFCAIMKTFEGIEDEVEKDAFLKEMQAWVLEKKQFSDMKKQLDLYKRRHPNKNALKDRSA